MVTKGFKNPSKTYLQWSPERNGWVILLDATAGAWIHMDWKTAGEQFIELTCEVQSGSVTYGVPFDEILYPTQGNERLSYGFGINNRIWLPFGSDSLPAETELEVTWNYYTGTPYVDSDGEIRANKTLEGTQTLSFKTPLAAPDIVLNVLNKGETTVDVETTGGKATSESDWMYFSYQYRNIGGKWKVAGNSKSSTFTYTNLQPNTSYQFRVVNVCRIQSVDWTMSGVVNTSGTWGPVDFTSEFITPTVITGGSMETVSSQVYDIYKWEFGWVLEDDTDHYTQYRIYASELNQIAWGTSYHETEGGIQKLEAVRDDGETSSIYFTPSVEFTYADTELGQAEAGARYYLNTTFRVPDGPKGWQDMGTVRLLKGTVPHKWSLHFVMDYFNVDETYADLWEVDIDTIAPTIEMPTDIKVEYDSVEATFNVSDWGTSGNWKRQIIPRLFNDTTYVSGYRKQSTPLDESTFSFTYKFTQYSPFSGSPYFDLEANQKYYLTTEASNGSQTNTLHDKVVEIITPPKNLITFKPTSTPIAHNTVVVDWVRDEKKPQVLTERKQIWYRPLEEGDEQNKLAYDGTDNKGILTLTNLVPGKIYVFVSTVTTEKGKDTVHHGPAFKTATNPEDPRDLTLYWNQDLSTPLLQIRNTTSSNDQIESFDQGMALGGTTLIRRIDDYTCQVEASAYSSGKNFADSTQAIGTKLLPNNVQIVEAFNKEYGTDHIDIDWDQPTLINLDNYDSTWNNDKRMLNVNLFRITYDYSRVIDDLTWTFDANNQTICVNGTMVENRCFPITGYSEDHGYIPYSLINHSDFNRWLGDWIQDGDWYTVSLTPVSGSVTEGDLTWQGAIGNLSDEGVLKENDVWNLPVGNSSSFISKQYTKNDSNAWTSLGLVKPNSAYVFNNYTFKLSIIITEDEVTDQPTWTKPHFLGTDKVYGTDYAYIKHLLPEDEFTADSPLIRQGFKIQGHFRDMDPTELKEILTYDYASMQPGSWQEFNRTNQSSKLVDDLSTYSHRALELSVSGSLPEVYASTTKDYSTEFIVGHKYFIRFKAKSNNDASVEMFWPSEAGHSMSFDIVGDNEYHDFAMIFEATPATSTDFAFRLDNNHVGTDTQIMRFTMPIMVDLTKAAGEGKEPSLQWCDRVLTYQTFYPNPAEAQLINSSDFPPTPLHPDYTYFIGNDTTMDSDSPVKARRIANTELNHLGMDMGSSLGLKPIDPTDLDEIGTIYFIVDSQSEADPVSEETEFKEVMTQQEYDQIIPQPNKIYYIGD